MSRASFGTRRRPMQAVSLCTRPEPFGQQPFGQPVVPLTQGLVTRGREALKFMNVQIPVLHIELIAVLLGHQDLFGHDFCWPPKGAGQELAKLYVINLKCGPHTHRWSVAPYLLSHRGKGNRSVRRQGEQGNHLAWFWCGEWSGVA
ncbi:hypothetical protein ACVWZD_004576 [Streptomyces sp. TE3672]